MTDQTSSTQENRAEKESAAEHKTGHPDYYKAKLSHKPFSKYAIALRAAAELSEGESFLIDAGSSLTPIAKIVKSIGDSNANLTHYTIMTHNNAAFQALQDVNTEARFNVFYTGGRYDRDLNASFGHQAELAYKDFNPHWVFIGQNGMEAHQGLFCHGNTEELSLKKNIFAMPTLKRVIISDFEKIGQLSGLVFGESSELTSNVTDCYVFTDDIHDNKFKSYIENENISKMRFDQQCRILEETYFVEIIKVRYDVRIITPENGIIKKLKIKTVNNSDFLEEPVIAFDKIIAKIKEIGQDSDITGADRDNSIKKYEDIKYEIHLKSGSSAGEAGICGEPRRHSAHPQKDNQKKEKDKGKKKDNGFGYVKISFVFRFDKSRDSEEPIYLESVGTEVKSVYLNWIENGIPNIILYERNQKKKRVANTSRSDLTHY